MRSKKKNGRCNVKEVESKLSIRNICIKSECMCTYIFKLLPYSLSLSLSFIAKF